MLTLKAGGRFFQTHNRARRLRSDSDAHVKGRRQALSNSQPIRAILMLKSKGGGRLFHIRNRPVRLRSDSGSDCVRTRLCLSVCRNARGINSVSCFGCARAVAVYAAEPARAGARATDRVLAAGRAASPAPAPRPLSFAVWRETAGAAAFLARNPSPSARSSAFPCEIAAVKSQGALSSV
jgi:hypothetical protein